MGKLTFAERAWAEYLQWQTKDPKLDSHLLDDFDVRPARNKISYICKVRLIA